MSGRPQLRVTVLTGFPALFASLDAEGIVRIALQRGCAELRIVDLREYARDRHRTIDDYPYGGGPGMIMKAGPVLRALAALPPAEGPRERLLLSPQGRPLVQRDLASRAARGGELVLICGRYKGVDERIRSRIDGEISLGDYVLSGGELAAMVMIDGLYRLIPGVLGDLDSARGDSFSSGLLDGAWYTRPEECDGQRVPEVLLSGHHAEIRQWRRRSALRRTWERRPELLTGVALSDEDRCFLRSLGWPGAAGGAPARVSTETPHAERRRDAADE
ncbi:MAG: tRNA (guanosine(37)-N1)-methyltransferase TrmD [Candidatus Eisenbacteria bacterium]|nr:tRNA (guanosine(37)-N1)-methyltransferase TrmD [Candidatus Eisenbacteria bacterium]